MVRAYLAALCAAGLLAGCSTLRGGGDDDDVRPEFVGRTLRVETAQGQVSHLRARDDGSVIARFGERETSGRWSIERRRLCFTWAQNWRECWPYQEPFRRGRTVALTSDRGNKVRVTLQ